MTDETTTDQQYEEPEGLDTDAKAPDEIGLSSYPIDSVLIRQQSRTVFDVIRRMDNDQYILDPDFQREFVWEEEQQVKLIESALMRIPLPVFYLAENADGKVVVVDGLQRLTTFQRFLKNQLTLSGLKGESESLNGKTFDMLPPKLQNRIEDTQLVLYLIDSQVPDRARLDIFDRVNSGTKLTRQQMRNCLHVGDATRWLRDRARSPLFQRVTTSSLNWKTMRDREAINRFCSFYLLGVEGYRNTKGDMDEFLAQALTQMNKRGKQWLDDHLTPAFERSMQNNYTIFDHYAFRKHIERGGARNIINIALFDVYSVLMTRYSPEFVAAHVDDFYERFFALQKEPAFYNAISNSTNSVANIALRFDMIEKAHADLPADIEEA